MEKVVIFLTQEEAKSLRRLLYKNIGEMENSIINNYPVSARFIEEQFNLRNSIAHKLEEAINTAV